LATLDDLNAWLVNAPTQEAESWHALARLWQLDVGLRTPCQDAKQQQVQCFQSAAGLDLIRQLQRPCALGLFDREGRSVFAILTGLTSHTATLAYSNGYGNAYGNDPQTQRITVALADLAKVWRGDFSTLWRSPPNYQQRLEAGQSGPAVTWLAQRLAQWRQQPVPEGPQQYVPALQAQVHAFQITQGIKPDGIAGAMTLMQLNRLTGVDEPRLNAEYKTER
jgi:general secretion pathway protein A